MKTIVRTLFGSRLYGTATPDSDTDYKSVHLPAGPAILLHKTIPVISIKTKSDNSQKNSAQDIDDESFTLHRFFDNLERGDIVALDMLFAPESNLLVKSAAWEAIQAVRPRLLTKDVKGAIGYVRKQCSKYGVKGSRVATTRAALESLNVWIGTYGSSQKLSFFEDSVRDFVQGREHTSIEDVPQANGTKLPHWEVCERKLPFTISLKECQHILTKLFENYGERSRKAEANEGVDWKAVSHAVRCGYQSIELLNYGHITFPRPEADYLVRIKTGKLPYKDVAEELEWLMDGVESAARSSHLPDAVDRELMNSIVLDLYEDQVLESPGANSDWWPGHLITREAA